MPAVLPPGFATRGRALDDMATRGEVEEEGR